MSRIDFYGFLGVGLGLLIGMIGHEFAHARVAVSLGDPTPRMMGRLTLNPRAHVDPFGTIIMPGILLLSILFRAQFLFFFGYAKPVIINPGRLRNPRRDAMIVALAGPAFNLAIVAAVGIAFRQGASREIVTDLFSERGLYWILFMIAVVNTFLFIINILPIPPLDGSKVLARFLSPAAAMKMEEWGQYLILFVIALFILFRGVLQNIAEAIYVPILGL